MSLLLEEKVQYCTMMVLNGKKWIVGRNITSMLCGEVLKMTYI